VGKTLVNYLILLILLGLGVILLNYFVFLEQPPESLVDMFVTLIFATLSIGMVPLIVHTLIIQNRALKQNLLAAKEMNQALSERIKPNATENGLITLTGSTKESITVKPENIVYIEATGNYVNVHYKHDDTHTYKLLRSTIKQAEESLQNQPEFVRCHRAFIVNADKIYHVTGNAQGYKLSLYDTMEEIPVSRTYLNTIKDVLRGSRVKRGMTDLRDDNRPLKLPFIPKIMG